MSDTNPTPNPSPMSDDPTLTGPAQSHPVTPPELQLPPPAPVSAYSAPVYSSPPPTNAWALISIIASILSWLGLFGIGGIVGIVAGVVARNEIAASRGTQTGDGIALTGIILGAVNVVGSCLVLMCAATFLLGLPLFFGPFGNGR